MRDLLPSDHAHQVRMVSKLAKRLGIARAKSRSLQLNFDSLYERYTKMRQDLSDLAHQVRVLREANRVLGELLDYRDRRAAEDAKLIEAAPKVDPFTDPAIGF